MKKILAIASLIASVCLLGGCDFFRQLAGRPTSQDIEQKRQVLAQRAALLRQQEDSLRLVREREQELKRLEADSLAALEELHTSKVKVIPSPRVASARAELAYEYYVMIGAFSVPEFARKQASRAEQAGYTAVEIPFRNGITAVGACPSNSLAEVLSSLKKLRGESFCPAEAWILHKE